MKEKEFRSQLKKCIGQFTEHVIKYNKVGNKRIDISDKLAVSLISEKPKIRDKFYLQIEWRHDPSNPISNESFYKTNIYSIPVFNINTVRSLIRESIKDVYSNSGIIPFDDLKHFDYGICRNCNGDGLYYTHDDGYMHCEVCNA